MIASTLTFHTLCVRRHKKTAGMGAARAWKHRFFVLFLVLLLGMQKKNKLKIHPDKFQDHYYYFLRPGYYFKIFAPYFFLSGQSVLTLLLH
jgi:hypothetical protein